MRAGPEERRSIRASRYPSLLAVVGCDPHISNLLGVISLLLLDKNDHRKPSRSTRDRVRALLPPRRTGHTRAAVAQ